ncbi:hypothetical protein GGQ11_001279 [Salinibacter ruber]|uniref:DUF3179 domain-containing protein n=2 Tax=Salinibacter ruber TaxID=146919 RepID=A0A9X2U899_9BACT|nr:DUF3179 domain-containing protein [Salinibacter ruber]MCS3656505.1 hypothetical protein [Salinibacter ruber]MCS3951568.1 hypothetical protein [Salinibacter ruber]MCS4148396.1 hypothetical protein [Salinibacter ruber]MCS4188890.1 hypothetical protein [Salinibacter ruber]
MAADLASCPMTDSPSVQHRLVFVLGLVGLWIVSVAPGARAQSSLPPDAPPALQQFDTAYSKHNIDLSTLMSGGPPKDGIPSVDNPSFVSVGEASNWVSPEEPVILLEHKGTARAYPLQILTHHEIVNDRVAGTPVAVTFCPLCYSALVFERTLDGEPVEFGVSGLLRNSDLVMYDRKTETLWQQLTGKAIVGDLAGRTLTQIPSQIVSFRQFGETHPDGAVLSRDTGHDRPYGRNPYAGYDDIDNKPFAYRGPTDDRLPPMAKVVAVTIGDRYKAYPHSKTEKKRVLHDTVAGRPLAVFHAPGAVSALDAAEIAESKETGSTGVFDRRVDGRTLTFSYVDDGRFEDEDTESTWTVTGKAVDGPLEGTQLDRVQHGDYFAFAWFAFRPDAALYGAGGSL